MSAATIVCRRHHRPTHGRVRILQTYDTHQLSVRPRSDCAGATTCDSACHQNLRAASAVDVGAHRHAWCCAADNGFAATSIILSLHKDGSPECVALQAHPKKLEIRNWRNRKIANDLSNELDTLQIQYLRLYFCIYSHGHAA